MRRKRRSSQYAYGVAPVIHHSRSIFNLSHKHLFSTSVGRLTPCLLEEVYPGDDFRIRASMVTRVTSSFLKPVMDDLFADLYFFFVPSRLLMDDWEQVFGSAKPSQWSSPEYASVPQIIDLSDTTSGTISDYFGIPTIASSYLSISVLPFRAYAKIYNDWFRDENLVDEVLIQMTSDGNSDNALNPDPFSASNYLGMCANVAKTHDYFTQLLPKPQKGNAVNIGLAQFPATSAPVSTAPWVSSLSSPNGYPVQWVGSSGINVSSPSHLVELDVNGLLQVRSAVNNPGSYGRLVGPAGTSGTSSPSINTGIVPLNLVADVPQTDITSATVNDLRFAFQLQKMLERDSLGTRYVEYLRNHFGVDAGDARLQRSEYLGGRRIPIKVQQVAQTSEASDGSPLANVAAYSVTGGQSSTVAKGFVEHGYIIGLVAFRQYHTYQQGIRPLWMRKQRSDFYDPIFANIGDQPVYLSEIYAPSDNSPSTVFGYKPAWDELRTSPNLISGQMRSAASEGLDIWHFADNYSTPPALGQQFIEETPVNVDRTLSVPSTTVDNFIVDMWFDETAVRALPTFGIPGLIDHH